MEGEKSDSHKGRILNSEKNDNYTDQQSQKKKKIHINPFRSVLPPSQNYALQAGESGLFDKASDSLEPPVTFFHELP
jgi:hypothetical protein